MPEGKQLSFQYGEVSPSIRYRSDTVFRNAALFKLYNGFVRKEGGISNRPGMVMIAEHPDQTYVPVGKQDPKVVFHRFKNSETGEDRIISVAERWFLDVVGGTYANRILVYDREFSETSDITTVSGGPVIRGEVTEVEDLTCIHYGEADGTFSIANQSIALNTGAGDEYVNSSFNMDTQDATTAAAGTISTPLSLSGSAPLDIPVTYKLTSINAEGQEKTVFTEVYAAGHPHQFLGARFTITGIYFDKAFRYNIYRASGSTNGVFGLVDSIVPTTTGVQNYTFTDFIITADILNGPPTDHRLWGEGKLSFGTFNVLYTATRMMKYQQRLFISYQDDEIDSNTLGVSKLGSLKMLSTPIIYNDIGAFEFNLPVRYSGSVVHMLALERAIIFTEDDVFMVAGATEQGVITPSQPNPILISSEGCSPVVAPRNVGNVAFYVNSDHSKIMRIEVSSSGQTEINEISILSNHFFSEDLIRLEYVKTPDADFVYVLRRDGKIITVQVSADTVGFSLYETEGRVEDICALPSDFRFSADSEYVSATEINRNKRPTEGLMCTVIRDGVRYIEAMYPRQDVLDEGFNYADASKYFGTRLSRASSGEYIAVGAPATATDGHYCESFAEIAPIAINIPLGGGYDAGEATRLWAQTDLSTTVGAATYLDFYYEDDDGYTRTIRWTRTGSPNWNGGASTFNVDGYFNADVPLVLRNVLNSPTFSISTYEALGYATRYSIPINQVTGLTHLANKDVSVFADNEVISSPLNPSDTFTTLTVSGAGVLDLPDYFGYGVVGLPYVFEMETLPLEPSDNRTLVSENKIINEAGIAFDKTRGGYASDQSSADDVSKMEPIVFRENEDFDAPSESFTGHIDVNFSGSYDRDSRAKIKQVDPLPMTVLSVYPKGVSGG